MITTTQSSSSGSSRQAVEARLDPGLIRRLRQPNLPAARESAAVFRECFRLLASRAGLGEAEGQAVERRALLASFDPLLALRAGDPALTASLLVDRWNVALAQELRAGTRPQPAWSSIAEVAEGSAVASPSLDAGTYVEWHLLFNQAVEQLVALESGTGPVRTALRSLMTRLELSQDDLGRMLGVSGETVRRWERGATGIPAERRSAILAAESGLRRLQDLFRPERLPSAIRRPAELFDGETALEWILRGRIGMVADRYEAALLYQA